MSTPDPIAGIFQKMPAVIMENAVKITMAGMVGFGVWFGGYLIALEQRVTNLATSHGVLRERLEETGRAVDARLARVDAALTDNGREMGTMSRSNARLEAAINIYIQQTARERGVAAPPAYPGNLLQSPPYSSQ